jgi:hypothetical protein
MPKPYTYPILFDIKAVLKAICIQIKKGFNEKTLKPFVLLWAQQGLNL